MAILFSLMGSLKEMGVLVTFAAILKWLSNFNFYVVLFALLVVLSSCLLCLFAHNYENMPIQIHRKFSPPKHEKFQIKNTDIFHISAQNIDCGTR